MLVIDVFHSAASSYHPPDSSGVLTITGLTTGVFVSVVVVTVVLPEVVTVVGVTEVVVVVVEAEPPRAFERGVSSLTESCAGQLHGKP